jgi:hypothetical protein
MVTGNFRTPCKRLYKGQSLSHLPEKIQGSLNIPQVQGGSDHIRPAINEGFQKGLVVQLFLFGRQETRLVGHAPPFLEGVLKIKPCDRQIFPGAAAFIIKPRELEK